MPPPGGGFVLDALAMVMVVGDANGDEGRSREGTRGPPWWAPKIGDGITGRGARSRRDVIRVCGNIVLQLSLTAPLQEAKATSELEAVVDPGRLSLRPLAPTV